MVDKNHARMPPRIVATVSPGGLDNVESLLGSLVEPKILDQCDFDNEIFFSYQPIFEAHTKRAE